MRVARQQHVLAAVGVAALLLIAAYKRAEPSSVMADAANALRVPNGALRYKPDMTADQLRCPMPR